MGRYSHYEKKGKFELSPDLAARAASAVEQAEKDLQDANVNFRWGKNQINVVKQAASSMGIPYQTYMKQVVYRQAIQDLQDISSVNSAIRSA